MPTIFPTPCIGCLNEYICPDGIVDVRCIKYESGTLSDWITNIVSNTGAKIEGVEFVCEEFLTITHNLNLTDPENIIIQIINEVDGTNVYAYAMENFTTNTVDIRLDFNCADTYRIIIK